MRSRAVSRPFLCCDSIALSPPPVRMISSSLRIWVTSSATAFWLRSKRDESVFTLLWNSDGDPEWRWSVIRDQGQTINDKAGERGAQRGEGGFTTEARRARRRLGQNRKGVKVFWKGRTLNVCSFFSWRAILLFRFYSPTANATMVLPRRPVVRSNSSNKAASTPSGSISISQAAICSSLAPW